MCRKTLIPCVLMILFLCVAGIAQSGEREMPFKAGSLYLDPTAGAAFFLADGDLDINTNALVGARTGMFITNHISLETSFEYLWSGLNGPIDGSRTRTFGAIKVTALSMNMLLPMLNFNYHFSPILLDGLVPFVYAGAGVGIFNWAKDWDYGVAGNYGIGLKYSVNKYVGLRVDVRNLITGKPYTNDLVATAGFSFRYPFAKEAPAAAPPPLPTVAPPPPPDTDNDGVADHLDKCPGTAPGQPVDDVGCPYLSKTGTLYEIPLSGVLQRGIVFDMNSAVIRPSCYSLLDEVAKTIKASPDAKVEIAGYTDITGPAAFNLKLSQQRAESVMKYLVAKGVPASQLTAVGYGEGNPMTSNATPEGQAMNRRIEFHLLTPVDMSQVQEGSNLYRLGQNGVQISGVMFQINSATIKPSSYSVLDEVAQTLRAFPTIKVEIGGYTDTTGTEQFNLQLSQKRANAVRDYLIKAGVKPDQVVSKGYGEASPIASNDTEAGREKNRRIEIKVISR